MMTPSLIVKYFCVPPSPVFPSQPSKSCPLNNFTGFSPSGNLTDADQSPGLSAAWAKCRPRTTSAASATNEVRSMGGFLSERQGLVTRRDYSEGLVAVAVGARGLSLAGPAERSRRERLDGWE